MITNIKLVCNSKRTIKFPHTRDENTTRILLELDFSHLWINKIPQWRFTNFKYANATLSRLILITCFVMQILVHRTLMLSNNNCASCNTHVLCMNCIGFPYSGFIYGRHWRYFSSRRVIFHVRYAFSSSITEMNGEASKKHPLSISCLLFHCSELSIYKAKFCVDVGFQHMFYYICAWIQSKNQLCDTSR